MNRATNDYAHYANQYKTLLFHWKHGRVALVDYFVFEVAYALHLKHLLWRDIPPDFEDRYDLPHQRDYGVDTVSLAFSQTAQIKYYHQTSVKWSDITNYTALSGQVLGISKMCIGTTPEARVTDRMLLALCAKQRIPILRHTRDALVSDALKGFAPHEAPERTTTIELRPYLLAAHAAIVAASQPVVRLQLPCGTGKSYVMLHTMLEHLRTDASRRFCVFCPWVDLAKQLRDLFATRLNVLFLGDGERTTTDDARAFQVAVCVYPSVEHLPDVSYALKIYDEAHHLEDEDAVRRKQLDAVRGDKTLMFSATFHDEDVDYAYTLREAIDDGHIADYVLHVEYFTSGDRTQRLVDTMVEHADWYPAFIYFNSTEKCKAFYAQLHARGVSSAYLVGGDGRAKRESIRDRLQAGLLSVLCLCGCYNEGISIDTIRTVVFGELRHSSINKIQIASRANRKHPTKPFYRVVLPLTGEDFNGKDVRDLVQTFARVDPAVKRALQNEQQSRSRIQVHLSPVPDTDTEDAEWMYEEIYNRCGEMVQGRTFDEWCTVLFAYCDEHGILPPATTAYQGCNVGIWLNNQKTKVQSSPDLYAKLVTHPVVKAGLDKFLVRRAKSRPSFSRTETRVLLFAYCDEHGKVPPAKTTYHGCNVSSWLSTQKKALCGGSDDPVYAELAAHAVVKAELDRYLATKAKAKGDAKPKLAWDEWRALLFAYCDEHGKMPPQGTTYQGQKLNSWCNNQKTKLRDASDPKYARLATNAVVKADLERYLSRKVTTRTAAETRALLFAYCDEYGFVPKFRTTYHDCAIGQWLQHQKFTIQSNDDLVYVELATHAVVKKALDQYLARKAPAPATATTAPIVL